MARSTGDEFKDPEIQIWENVDFADNYFQTSVPNSGDVPTLSQEGRAILGALNVDLSNTTGFTQDDFTASAGFNLPSSGLGGIHDRLISWYAGTVDLSQRIFQVGEAPDEVDPIWRRRVDGKAYDNFFSLISGFISSNVPDLVVEASRIADFLFDTGIDLTQFDGPEIDVPWYIPPGFAVNNDDDPNYKQIPTDGIGTGWAFSTLGGK